MAFTPVEYEKDGAVRVAASAGDAVALAFAGWRVVGSAGPMTSAPVDTGWRDVGTLLNTAEWELQGGIPMLHLRRIGPSVHLVFRLRSSATATGNFSVTRTILVVPAGFVPVTFGSLGVCGYAFAATIGVVFNYNAVNTIQCCVPGSSTAIVPSSTRNMGQVSWLTNDVWPSTLPGVAV